MTSQECINSDSDTYAVDTLIGINTNDVTHLSLKWFMEFPFFRVVYRFQNRIIVLCIYSQENYIFFAGASNYIRFFEGLSYFTVRAKNVQFFF